MIILIVILVATVTAIIVVIKRKLKLAKNDEHISRSSPEVKQVVQSSQKPKGPGHADENVSEGPSAELRVINQCVSAESRNGSVVQFAVVETHELNLDVEDPSTSTDANEKVLGKAIPLKQALKQLRNSDNKKSAKPVTVSRN